MNTNQISKTMNQIVKYQTPEEVYVNLGYTTCPCCGAKTKPMYVFELFRSGYRSHILTNKELNRMCPSLHFASIQQKVEYLKQHPVHFIPEK